MVGVFCGCRASETAEAEEEKGVSQGRGGCSRRESWGRNRYYTGFKKKFALRCGHFSIICLDTTLGCCLLSRGGVCLEWLAARCRVGEEEISG